VVLIEMPTSLEVLKQQLPQNLYNALTSTQSTKDSIEFYISIHPAPAPAMCQHFLCSNTNELNMMYHAWVFPNVEFNDHLVVLTELSMGLFEVSGIKPVHLDLVDGGIPFESTMKRTVVIHHSAFSPENAQFQLDDNVHICSFFSLAIQDQPHMIRKVVCYHILPRYDADEQALTKAISQSTTLGDLVNNLKQISFVADVADRLEKIFKAAT